MSRSQPEATATNPAKFVLEWAGDRDAGYFRYYDKELKDTECKGRVKVDDLEFALLDERSAVLGWSQFHKASIYSNEVKYMNEPIVLLTFVDGKSKKLLEGVYKDIKAQAADMGARYHKIVYAMVTSSSDPNLEQGTVIRLKLKGAVVKAWGDLHGKNSGAIKYTVAEGQNGAVKYRYPVFEPKPLDPEIEEKALDCDRQLQEFFAVREEQNAARKEEQEEPSKEPEGIEEDVPF